MDDARFDALTRELAGTTRRGVMHLLAAATVGLLSREEAGAKHTGCHHHGKPCQRHRQCCSGRCSRRRRRCTCPGGTTKCGTTACCRPADQTCCGGTCVSGLLKPEGGSCPGDDSACCPGLTCTPNDSRCCRPENVCFKVCCLNGTRSTDEDVCCASGNSCNGVCCRRADDICTIADLECCRPENVCHRSCCNPLHEHCDGLNCVPIIGPIIGP
jgi:hypothetical protein